jgi:hypothetical protein
MAPMANTGHTLLVQHIRQAYILAPRIRAPNCAYYLRHLRSSVCGTRPRSGPHSWRRFAFFEDSSPARAELPTLTYVCGGCFHDTQIYKVIPRVFDHSSLPLCSETRSSNRLHLDHAWLFSYHIYRLVSFHCPSDKIQRMISINIIRQIANRIGVTALV